MDVDKIKILLGEHWEAMQEGIRAYLGTDIPLLDAVNSNLLANSGKQVRPMLSLLTAAACSEGKINEDAVKLAVASELMHNATLLHDDVADQADERRGKPTLRKMMGPQASVLVGDFWLVRALLAILDISRGRERVISLFAGTLADLAEGEMYQLQKASICDTDFEDYLRIVYGKTSSLFVVSCLSAAIAVGAPAEYEEAVKEYGRHLGYAFQMMDDIFDYTSPETVGKPCGVDVLEHKITLPLLCALEQVTAREQEEIRAAVREITPEGRDRIIEFVKEHKGVQRASKGLEEYSDKAVQALSVLPDTKYRRALEDMARYLAHRSS